MKLKAVDLVNLYLCVGTVMGLLGLYVFHQYWWVIGGAAIFYMAIISAEIEIQKQREEFWID
jgi:hypothetical protein